MKPKLIYFLLFLNFASFVCCSPNKDTYSNYYNCVEKEDSDFFRDMEQFEQFLLKEKILNNKNMSSYLSLFEKTPDENMINAYFGSYNNFKDNIFNKKFKVLSFCSDFSKEESINNNDKILKIYKYNLKKLFYNSNNPEALDELFILTNFSNDNERFVVLYIYLLNKIESD